MNRKIIILLIIFSLLFITKTFAVEVRNTGYIKQGSYIIFSYDLYAEDNEEDAIVFFTLKIGNKIYSPDKLHIKGDFGKLKIGKEKKIIWNAIKDFPLGIPPFFDYQITAAGKTFKDPFTGMQFVRVRGGCFEMGDFFGDGDSNERPVHEVCVDDFYMGKYEVTIKEFKKFINETNYLTEAEKGNGCNVFINKRWVNDPNANWKNPGFLQDELHPVVCISWNDVLAFIEWLRKNTLINYRLPTEAENEYAARSGGKKYKYSWGDASLSGNVADESAKRQFADWTVFEGYDDGYVFTAPVGNYKPNELGLYDMTGNVFEWTLDWYGEKFYKESPLNNPKGPLVGTLRTLRGGSWNNGPWGSRVSFRGRYEPNIGYNDIGFRLVIPIKE